ncbi:DUF547 domain-containing protein [Anthocerotibacter panamensis]|uniref:DUF547 domain-containing protein n=1 Tax=Anthocerotibacter panamensis TaxID=2857077 RepID=UPI001C404DE3|nr:DUF547 domain-containing protein [Anthocerotibacter panamensis]
MRSGIVLSILLGVLALPVWAETSPYNRLLTTYVDGLGRVDYARWKAQDATTLKDQINSFKDLDPETLPNRAAKLAFWINAYNAFALESVLERYPIETVRPGSFIPDLSFFKTARHEVHGHSYSLDEIENEVLRGQFKEPRIHFAIVCASRSCPRLRNRAYTADQLDSQLDEAARQFINDPKKNQYDNARGTVKLSKIFYWFRDDFGGSVSEFLKKYAESEALKALDNRRLKISYLDYDWGLNDRK